MSWFKKKSAKAVDAVADEEIIEGSALPTVDWFEEYRGFETVVPSFDELAISSEPTSMSTDPEHQENHAVALAVVHLVTGNPPPETEVVTPDRPEPVEAPLVENTDPADESSDELADEPLHHFDPDVSDETDQDSLWDEEIEGEHEAAVHFEAPPPPIDIYKEAPDPFAGFEDDFDEPVDDVLESEDPVETDSELDDDLEDGSIPGTRVHRLILWASAAAANEQHSMHQALKSSKDSNDAWGVALYCAGGRDAALILQAAFSLPGQFVEGRGEAVANELGKVLRSLSRDDLMDLLHHISSEETGQATSRRLSVEPISSSHRQIIIDLLHDLAAKATRHIEDQPADTDYVINYTQRLCDGISYLMDDNLEPSLTSPFGSSELSAALLGGLAAY